MRKGHLFAPCLAAVLLLLLLSACGGQTDEEEKTVVTIVTNVHMEHVEEFLETRLPDVDFQWEFLVSASFNSDVRRRLDAGDGPDLIYSTQPSGQDSGQYLLPLGGYSFSSRYASTMVNDLTVEDRLYYLPLPGQYCGYVVNKTFFDRTGIPLPTTDDELTSALRRFKEQGIGVNEGGYVFGFRERDDAALGNYLVGCMVPDFLGTTDGLSWLMDFERRESSMSGTWQHAFDLLSVLVEEGFMNLDPYRKQGNAPNNANYMAEGEMVAMYGYSSAMEECRTLNQTYAQQGGEAYEYTMLTFMGEAGTPNWTISMPSAYVGINATLDQPGNEATLDACCRVLDALSTQEGQEALLADTGADHSYLKDFAQSSEPPVGLAEAVEGGYVYNVKFSGKVIEYLGQQAALYLSGMQDIPQCLAAVDDYWIKGSAEVEEDLTVVGAVAQDLIYQSYNTRREETALGDLVADSVAALSGAPMAVVNGGGIRASLYEGAVRALDLEAVCPFDNQIVVVEMSGSVLRAMLENGLTALEGTGGVPGGRFLQVSGLRYTYDGIQPAGARLVEVTLPDGTPLDDQSVYTVAINNYMAGKNGYLEGNGDGNTMLNLYSDEVPKGDVTLVAEDLGTYREALAYYFSRQDAPVTAAVEGRITDLSESEVVG